MYVCVCITLVTHYIEQNGKKYFSSASLFNALPVSKKVKYVLKGAEDTVFLMLYCVDAEFSR